MAKPTGGRTLWVAIRKHIDMPENRSFAIFQYTLYVMHMKIILAMDSFKGCITSGEAEKAAADALKVRYPEAEILSIPLSDGGDGWLEAYSDITPCTMLNVDCHDALMRPVTAQLAVDVSGTVIIESARACGLTLIEENSRRVLRATSYGVGELLAAALRSGAKEIVVGLGGSASSDCGLGMLLALKESFGEEVFNRIRTEVRITLASDVENPLYGPRGAAVVFGKQKGACPEEIKMLDRRAETFARASLKRFGFDCSQNKGAGAAGGLGYAFMQYLGAQMEWGSDILLNKASFDEKLRGASFVLTGEGSADSQTLMGKLPVRILHMARERGVPVHLIAGRLQEANKLLDAGFASVSSINPPDMPLAEALKPERAKKNIALAMHSLPFNQQDVSA